ncbi:hypothetical protein D3C85_1655730 [compost metagenome]
MSAATSSTPDQPERSDSSATSAIDTAVPQTSISDQLTPGERASSCWNQADLGSWSKAPSRSQTSGSTAPVTARQATSKAISP